MWSNRKNNGLCVFPYLVSLVYLPLLVFYLPFGFLICEMEVIMLRYVKCCEAKDNKMLNKN